MMSLSDPSGTMESFEDSEASLSDVDHEETTLLETTAPAPVHPFWSLDFYQKVSLVCQ